MCTQTYTESPLERSFSPEKIRLVFMVMVYQKYDEFCMSFMFDDQFLLTRNWNCQLHCLLTGIVPVKL
ncbi:hypothetical protein OUZ56_019063 [Daphnia magna]|uniref:Uncharacterized protein n=1 Tax=Daphnia magna TaxID=35525 RepID=A0ABQ9ZAJ0_9CRUS|nr:hypothetical protein OUZ56_019063 [Daphnia magna]